mmetsp:Transcript_18162/g.52444  ORF Transcript_18162/g.52444 Transcript_18162/m.52444 type:complete len:222 (+) Transcript_18162:750-1415(+)
MCAAPPATPPPIAPAPMPAAAPVTAPTPPAAIAPAGTEMPKVKGAGTRPTRDPATKPPAKPTAPPALPKTRAPAPPEARATLTTKGWSIGCAGGGSRLTTSPMAFSSFSPMTLKKACLSPMCRSMSSANHSLRLRGTSVRKIPLKCGLSCPTTASVWRMLWMSLESFSLEISGLKLRKVVTTSAIAISAHLERNHSISGPSSPGGKRLRRMRASSFEQPAS